MSDVLPGTLIDRSFRERIILVGVLFPGLTAEAVDGGAPGRRYDFVYVDQPSFEEHRPKTFSVLVASFTEYKS